MRPQPMLFIVTCVAAIVAASFAGRSISVARRAQEAERRTVEALAKARSELQLAAEKPGGSKTANADAPVLAPAAADASASMASPTVAPTESADASPVSEAAKVRAAKLAEYREHLDETWGLLSAELGLTPEQVAAFKDLLGRREDNDWSLEARAKAAGLTEDSPEIAALDDEFLRGWKAELREVLGPAGYATYRDYFRDRHVAPVVTDLAAAMAGADAPMTTETAVSLMRALGNASERKASGSAIEDTLDWDKAAQAARPLLTPAQYAAFESVATRIQSDQRIKAQLRQLERTIASRSAP